jgi:hypothetical protein
MPFVVGGFCIGVLLGLANGAPDGLTLVAQAGGFVAMVNLVYWLSYWKAGR